ATAELAAGDRPPTIIAVAESASTRAEADERRRVIRGALMAVFDQSASVRVKPAFDPRPSRRDRFGPARGAPPASSDRRTQKDVGHAVAVGIDEIVGRRLEGDGGAVRIDGGVVAVEIGLFAGGSDARSGGLPRFEV